MPGPAYRMFRVDLSAASPGGAIVAGDCPGGSVPDQVIDVGIPLSDVCVIELPAAAVGLVFLRIGDRSADPVPLRLEGQNFHVYDACIQGGVFIDHPVAVPGAILRGFVGINTSIQATT